MQIKLNAAFCVGLLVATACLASAQQPLASPAARSSSGVAGSRPSDSKASTPQLQSRNPRYRINSGDVMDVAFNYTPEFNQTVTVQPDGFITLREIGDVHVAGETVPQVTQLVAKAYSKILHEPAVSILLKDFEKPHFTVGGEVGKPGKYELRSDTTLMESVSIAGGITRRSKHSQVLLFRRVSDDWFEVHKYNLKEIQKGELREDVHLQPGDMVFVPQNKISKVSQYLPSWGLSTYTSPAQY